MMVEFVHFGIKRVAELQADATWKITVTPPPLLGLPSSDVVLTQAQYNRYLHWRMYGGLIQDELPDLSAGEREVLLTGISEADFDEAFRLEQGKSK